MGTRLSTLGRRKYTMLPTKDSDIQIEQSAEETANDRSALQSRRTFHARYLSRET